MHKKLSKLIQCLILICLIIPSFLFGQSHILSDETKFQNTGFIDFNGYYDSRDFSVMTLNILGNLPNRFQYFSLTNFQGATKTSDLDNFFSEQNIRWQIRKKSPFYLVTQWVIRNGINNDNLRLGVRVKFNKLNFLENIFSKINISYSSSVFIVELADGRKSKSFTQLEHVYRINPFSKKLKDKLYIAGFADQNLIQNEDNKTSIKWVTEHQLGIMILKDFYAVLEYRINDFLPSNSRGFGYGLEYKINFIGQ